jgi:hypothetical protein
MRCRPPSVNLEDNLLMGPTDWAIYIVPAITLSASAYDHPRLKNTDSPPGQQCECAEPNGVALGRVNGASETISLVRKLYLEA